MSPKSILLGLALAARLAVAADAEYTDMGPAAFMWPPDRVWSAAADNTSPCGSVSAPNNDNRTDFPLDKGQVALVAQDESWSVQLSIAYNSDPKSNSDFKTLIEPKAFAELDEGHTCVSVGKAPDYVKAGDFATLQVKYISEFDTPNNETFYACADIKYVEVNAFTIEVPCFNATEPDANDEAGPGYDYHDHEKTATSSSSTPTSTSSTSDNASQDKSSSDGGKSSGMSKGAIAGTVVGSVVGAALIGAAALIFYRRKLQANRVVRQQKFEQGVGLENVSSASTRH